MKKILLILFFVFVMCSCSGNEPEPGITEENYENGVPDVMIMFENLDISEQASKGNYDWNEKNEDGTETNTIACGAHPLDFKDIAYFETFGKEIISFVFDKNMISYDLVRYEASSGEGYTGEETAEPVETENDSFTIAGDGNVYVYVLNVKYKNGTCEYAFKIRQGEMPIGRYKIVDGAESGNLVLAGTTPGDVMTLNVKNIPVFLDGEQADPSVLMDGMTAEIKHSGNILTTYPAKFEKAFEIHVYSIGTKNEPGGGFFDLCGLYLKVLDDIWNTDSGLNSGAEYVSLDIASAPGSLTDSEIAAISWIFENEHGVSVLNLTHDELREQGYLTAVDGFDDLYQWDNGVLISITPDLNADETEAFSLPVLRFDATKWRSPLGAYTFSGCKALWPEMGTWSDYTVEFEAIS